MAHDNDNHSATELMDMQARLVSLAEETTAYPLECSLGAYDLLFDSRDDIEIILDNLTEEIALSRTAA
jgi:hypothetical protein